MQSRRRRLLGLCGAMLGARPLRAFAQQAGRTYRLGVFGVGDLQAARRAFQPFLGLLAKDGFVEGRNLQVVLKVTPSESAPPGPVAAEFAAEKLDAVMVTSQGAAFAMKATSPAPVVIVVGFDPVAAGLVSSFARPGGNLTGVTLLSLETGNKRLELIKELYPAVRRIHYLNQAAHMHFIDAQLPHARKLGVAVEPLQVESVRDLEKFFARPLGRDEAVSVATSALNYVLREPMVAHANRAQAQIVYPFVESAEAGGLVAYAGDLGFAMARAMSMVARIFKGEKPGELAFEQVSRVILVVNMKTASQIGVTVPRSVLVRADRVIQ